MKILETTRGDAQTTPQSKEKGYRPPRPGSDPRLVRKLNLAFAKPAAKQPARVDQTVKQTSLMGPKGGGRGRGSGRSTATRKEANPLEEQVLLASERLLQQEQRAAEDQDRDEIAPVDDAQGQEPADDDESPDMFAMLMEGDNEVEAQPEQAEENRQMHGDRAEDDDTEYHDPPGEDPADEEETAATPHESGGDAGGTGDNITIVQGRWAVQVHWFQMDAAKDDWKPVTALVTPASQTDEAVQYKAIALVEGCTEEEPGTLTLPSKLLGDDGRIVSAEGQIVSFKVTIACVVPAVLVPGVAFSDFWGYIPAWLYVDGYAAKLIDEAANLQGNILELNPKQLKEPPKAFPYCEPIINNVPLYKYEKVGALGSFKNHMLADKMVVKKNHDFSGKSVRHHVVDLCTVRAACKM